MLRLLLALLPVALTALSPVHSPAHAADITPQQFVTGLYKTYQGKDSLGIPVTDPRFRASVTPGLWRLIKADSDRAARRGEAPDLDADPFIDGQDWEIDSFTVSVEPRGEDKALAAVSFVNFGDKVTVKLPLVKIAGDWKIDDFQGTRRKSVRALLERKKR